MADSRGGHFDQDFFLPGIGWAKNVLEVPIGAGHVVLGCWRGGDDCAGGCHCCCVRRCVGVMILSVLDDMSDGEQVEEEARLLMSDRLYTQRRREGKVAA